MSSIVFRYNEPEENRVKKLNLLSQGRVKAATSGSFILASNSLLTTVSDPMFTVSCIPVAVSLATNQPTLYVADRTNGEVTFGHSSDNVSNRAYAYTIIS